jgi:hypothetical protein
MSHELVQGNRKVTLCFIGEGYNGEYDPSDPEDAPLLRFDIYELINGEWEAMDDASYCTGIRADSEPDVIVRHLQTIMAFTGPLARVKKAAEQLSWLS